ncbi:MAG: prepilin-type N-terminal cleavage/methylation domain-containing protein [Planctomycetota bacterium]
MKRRQHGFSILEMIVAVSLMAVVMAIFGRLVVASVTVQGRVHDAAWSQDRMGQALDAIRADVWTADAWALDANGVLAIEAGDQRRVSWSAVKLERSVDDGRSFWALRREALDEQGLPSGTREFALPPLAEPPAWRTGDTPGVVAVDIGGVVWRFTSESRRLRAKGGER